MLQDVHKHIVSELQQSARTDTVFIVSAVLYNLIILGVNWGVAEGNQDGGHPTQNDFILILLIIATFLINTFVLKALLSGKDMRLKLLDGLVRMYKDNDVDKYYDTSLLEGYHTRYKLFSIIISILAFVAIVIPLLIRFL